MQPVHTDAKCGPCGTIVTHPETAGYAPSVGYTRNTTTMADVCICWTESFVSAFGCPCDHVNIYGLCGAACICDSHHTVTTALFLGARPVAFPVPNMATLSNPWPSEDMMASLDLLVAEGHAYDVLNQTQQNPPPGNTLIEYMYFPEEKRWMCLACGKLIGYGHLTRRKHQGKLWEALTTSAPAG